MPNDDEEKTRPLYDLGELNSNNQIFEISKEEQIKENNFIDEPPMKKIPKEKGSFKLKKWWNKFSKKQKITTLLVLVVFLVLMAVGVFFLLKNNKKEEVTPKQPDIILQEENYRYENGKLIFLNTEKEEIGSYNCSNANQELCFVAYSSNEDELDRPKKLYQDQSSIQIRSAIIRDQYVFVSDNPRKEDTLLHLYDMKNNQIIEDYVLVKSVENNNSLYILKDKNGYYGTLDFSGEEPKTGINFTLNYLAFVPNQNNFFVATQGMHHLLLKEDGSNASKFLNGKIKNLNQQYVTTLNDQGKYEVYDFNGKNILEESFDYIELYDDYVAVVKDNQLYFRFYDQNKLSEEGISLSNSNYVKTSIYDHENKLIEKKSAFSVEENNQVITVTVDDKNTILNKLEGIVSKKMKFANYFDGKLYFYSDIAKKERLGVYTCTNKNTIKSETDTLTNCFVASDTVFEENDYEIAGSVGFIPIFNERFVFVRDNPDLVNEENKTIVLYDLKKNNQLGKYAEVNTYSYTGIQEINFKTVNDVQVVAKNKSQKYGVIKIGLSEVTGHINFNYNHIESLRDCYIVQDAQGYLLLNKKDGSSLTSALTYKMRNYNLNGKMVKVKNNNKYYLYDFAGKKVELSKNGYAYIELYDEFFATVDSNNHLDVYSYKKPTESLIKGKDIVLNSKNYYGNGTLAFKINQTSNGEYEVFVGNKDQNYTSVFQFNFVKGEE